MADEVARTQTRLHRDIAARIKVQQALLASQEQYRTMFNASIDGLALWSRDGAIVGTSLKRNGNVAKPVDAERVRLLKAAMRPTRKPSE